MSDSCITLLAMRLTGTESIHDDLWSTAVYDHASHQYTVTYRTDVEDGYTAAVWQSIPVEDLTVVDNYFDVDLDREVVILQRTVDA